MIPLLICALISLGVADNLDTLYPDLEHSRTIYVTGEHACVVRICVCGVTRSFSVFR